MYLPVYEENLSFISHILKVEGSLGENLEFFSPLGYKIESSFDLETTEKAEMSILFQNLHH